jgi:hypothetical protein
MKKSMMFCAVLVAMLLSGSAAASQVVIINDTPETKMVVLDTYNRMLSQWLSYGERTTLSVQGLQLLQVAIHKDEEGQIGEYIKTESVSAGMPSYTPPASLSWYLGNGTRMFSPSANGSYHGQYASISGGGISAGGYQSFRQPNGDQIIRIRPGGTSWV